MESKNSFYKVDVSQRMENTNIKNDIYFCTEMSPKITPISSMTTPFQEIKYLQENILRIFFCSALNAAKLNITRGPIKQK